MLRETETFVVRASASDPTRTHSILLGAVQYTMCRARGTNLIKYTPYIKIGPASSQVATPGNAAVQQISVSPQTANLCGDWFTIRRVTALRATAENGVKELGSPSVSLGSMHWTQVGHANDVVAMATAGTPTMLYAATSDRTIWIRDPVEIDVNWQPFAPPAPAPVRGLAVVPSQNAPPFFSTSLIVATSTNRLFAYNPSFPLWHDIGHANNITGMTAYSGKLYATTSDNRLWRRELVFSEVNWEPIDQPRSSPAYARSPAAHTACSR